MDGLPLELSPNELRDLVSAAAEQIASYVQALPDEPASYSDAEAEDALARAMSARNPIPSEGRAAGEVLGALFRDVLGRGFNTAGPGYLAYIPGGGLPAAAVADLVAGVANRYVGIWPTAPAAVQLEVDVIRWLCGAVGYPDGAAGFLTTGGSLANLSAVVAARYNRLPEDFLAGTIYVSDQVHHSVRKAAVLAGFPARNVRVVPSDERFRMRVDALRAAVDADPQPFLVVASAGTTNTGAVDDLGAVADLCARRGLWMHVDAAYGGFFVLTERGRTRLRGIERADSISLDPHKGMFLPYGTGALLARDRETLHRAHQAQADYLPPAGDGTGRVDFAAISPELSRAFRGLRVWLPLQLHGVRRFREALEEKLDLARLAAERLRAIPDMEIVAEPQLSVVAFRHVPPGAVDGYADAWNRELLRRINERGRVFLSGTLLAGRFALRICVLSFRTHAERLEAALEDIRESIAGTGASSGR